MRGVRGLAFALVMVVTTSGVASARGLHLIAPPPPPPPTPVCGKACSGPPPPPTLLPTPQATQVAPQPVVYVKVAKHSIARGHVARVSVVASTNDAVTVQVYYRHTKPTTWRGKIGDSGTVVRTWTVPEKAPVGVGVVKVIVAGVAGKVQRTIPFLITR